MVTNQIMQRPFYGGTVSQRTKDGYFNGTELLKRFNELSGSQKRFQSFWENDNTKDFLQVLENEINQNSTNSRYLKTHETSRGKSGSTWMHPYLFVKFAMWLSPELEVKIIKWVYYNLIEFRIQAGDHYKEMCEAISECYYQYFNQKADPLIFIKEAHFLNQLVFGNPNGNQRNEASQKELELMNKLQLANIKMIRENTPKQIRMQNLVTFKNLYQ